jgi:hypothetical protein
MHFEYTIRSHASILSDSPQNIDFHIRSGDYFSFLATLMGFIEEAVASGENTEALERYRALARELRHDLRYVQANYAIVPRQLGDIQVVRPSGNLIKKRSAA